jgi:hypothetical protein
MRETDAFEDRKWDDMHMNKRNFMIAAITVFLIMGMVVPNTVQAMREMESQYVTKALNIMDGDWYDHSGKLVLQIHDGCINGCKVLTGYDFAGGNSCANGQFRILESTGTRNLYLSWDIRHSGKDSIKLNDSQMLHRTARVSFNESIADIHLGMTSSEVKSVLGQPSQTGDLKPYWGMAGWYYDGKQMVITFDADCVDRIVLLKNSKATLAKSGLNCSNTPYEFAQAYHMNRVPKVDYNEKYTFDGCHSIGDDEYLSFGNHMDYIMLTNYSN